MVDLRVNIAGVELANPIMTASGTCGYATEYADFVDLTQLGAFVTKSITPAPRVGNPPDRIVETRAGMLNAIGLANVGLQRFLDEKIPELETLGLPVFVNVAGAYLEDYITVTEALADVPIVRGIELNISCPNVKAGGSSFGTDPATMAAVVAAVRRRTRLPVIPKLAPNVPAMGPFARAAVEAGADALSLINTLPAMAIDIERRRPVLANRTGGLSGSAIHPVALKHVYDAAQAVKAPIIAMGGIVGAREAIAFLIAGATAVAVGTANFIDPTTPLRVIDGIRDYLIRHRMASVSELTGSLQT